MGISFKQRGMANVKNAFSIAGRTIGRDQPPLVIAEISGNHNGKIENALKLIDAAAVAGADAIKLQTYTPETITIDHNGPGFLIKEGLWAGRSLFDLYGEAYTPWEWHPILFQHARESGLIAFSSPFDYSAVDFLETLDCPAYKIASFEAIDIPLIEKAAATGKPLVISTGIANLQEIEDAFSAAHNGGCDNVSLLHCISGYPTPAKESNLNTIPYLADHFDAVIGLSDHTLGVAVSIASVVLGAAIIEKHVTLARDDGGPDAAFSLEPTELRELVDGCVTAWEALGTAGFERRPSEGTNSIFRRSLYVVEDIAAGEAFTEKNVRSIRPGYGLPPKNLPMVIGAVAAVNLTKGTPLEKSHIQEPSEE